MSSKTAPASQSALFKGPGNFGGVQVWRAKDALDPKALLHALASEQTLLGFSSDLIGVRHEPFLPMSRGDYRFPSTQASVLVQVAADTRDELLIRLRESKAVLERTCDLDEEVLGGRIGDGREAFGFRDGLKLPTHEDIEREAIIDKGECKHGSFLLYQRYQQALQRFSHLRERDQLGVFGITKEGMPLEKPSPQAHVPRAREYGHFIRRGFPYREAGHEGLVFIAAGKDTTWFEKSLRAMLGDEAGEPEALLRYAEPLSGGVYFAPALST
jgi:Dyp-type peroxidase family